MQFHPEQEDHFYFVTCHCRLAEEDEPYFSNGSASSTELHAPPFPGLTLGPLLGKGGFGCVYRGYMDDELVAVKVRYGGMTELKWVGWALIRCWLRVRSVEVRNLVAAVPQDMLPFYNLLCVPRTHVRYQGHMYGILVAY